ncbi:hypothetical protein ACF0H5_015071 [Mactra antiquata]
MLVTLILLTSTASLCFGNESVFKSTFGSVLTSELMDKCPANVYEGCDFPPQRKSKSKIIPCCKGNTCMFVFIE